MAAYPTLPTASGSDPEPLSKLAIDRAEDGSGRARALHSAEKRRWTLKHPYLTGGQKATLDAHYAAHRLAPFDYACPAAGATFSVLYTGAPKYEVQPGGHYVVTVDLEEA